MFKGEAKQVLKPLSGFIVMRLQFQYISVLRLVTALIVKTQLFRPLLVLLTVHIFRQFITMPQPRGACMRADYLLSASNTGSGRITRVFATFAVLSLSDHFT
jgi:hypothetical protein